MKIIIALLLLVAIQFEAKSQKIEKGYSSYLKAKVFTYHHEEQQIIFQKIIIDSSSHIYYNIGIIIYRKSLDLDDFMNEGASIKFEDNSTIKLLEPVQTNYLYSGQHQTAVKHKLSETEVELLKNKEIHSFQILKFEKKINKFLKAELTKAFNKLVTTE